MTKIEQIWVEHHINLTHYIHKRISDKTATEDILQEVFLKITKQNHRLDEVSNLPGWIYQIARNTIFDYYKNKTSINIFPTITREHNAIDDEEIVDRLTTCVQSYIKDLPDKYQKAIIYTQYNGLTQKEMGKKLGISLPGAKSRVQRAKIKIKNMLEDCCILKKDRRGKIINFTRKKQENF